MRARRAEWLLGAAEGVGSLGIEASFGLTAFFFFSFFFFFGGGGGACSEERSSVHVTGEGPSRAYRAKSSHPMSGLWLSAAVQPLLAGRAEAVHTPCLLGGIRGTLQREPLLNPLLALLTRDLIQRVKIPKGPLNPIPYCQTKQLFFVGIRCQHMLTCNGAPSSMERGAAGLKPRNLPCYVHSALSQQALFPRGTWNHPMDEVYRELIATGLRRAEDSSCSILVHA